LKHFHASIEPCIFNPLRKPVQGGSAPKAQKLFEYYLKKRHQLVVEALSTTEVVSGHGKLSEHKSRCDGKTYMYAETKAML